VCPRNRPRIRVIQVGVEVGGRGGVELLRAEASTRGLGASWHAHREWAFGEETVGQAYDGADGDARRRRGVDPVDDAVDVLDGQAARRRVYGRILGQCWIQTRMTSTLPPTLRNRQGLCRIKIIGDRGRVDAR
jgi:hypothetical protein